MMLYFLSLVCKINILLKLCFNFYRLNKLRINGFINKRDLNCKVQSSLANLCTMCQKLRCVTKQENIIKQEVAFISCFRLLHLIKPETYKIHPRSKSTSSNTLSQI